jgi:hypothetical protein
MALIHDRLLPEESGQPVIEQPGYLGLLAGRERLRSDRTPCATGQMKGMGGGAGVITHAISTSNSQTTQLVMKSRDPSKKKSSAKRMMNPNCSNWR